MTPTTAPTVKAQELVSYGLIESASVNSITDFSQSKFNGRKLTTERDDFVNIFICHLIFYAVFCVSLALHILIDLGLGTFIKNNFVQVLGLGEKTILEKGPALA